MTGVVEATAIHRLLARMSEARRVTDQLFAILSPDSLYQRPIAERHRIVFYVGHLEAFDWNLLHERLLGLKSFHPELDRLFAFGIDPVDGGLPHDQPQDWPAIEEVRGYVAGIRAKIDEKLEELDPAGIRREPGADWSPETLLNVAVEHRLMHAETLAYMFHQLPCEQKIHVDPSPRLAARSLTSRPVSSTPLSSTMIDVPAGAATLGHSRGDPEAFGWDNEFEVNTAHVPAFAIDNHKVTNRQWLAFMNAGGYQNRELWTESDWAWRSAENIESPAFWNRNRRNQAENNNWRYRTMFREIPLHPDSQVMDWPVYVSHAEAGAYARWAGKSLPTEAEWHRAAFATPDGGERCYPWGDELGSNSPKGNFDFASWDPTPIGAFPESASAFGVDELVGNGWEWTSSEFRPFPGFKEFSFYPGYSANFFDSKHYVIKGGSARTAACMLRRSFRNWFQPHYQYVYAGFRCVTR